MGVSVSGRKLSRPVGELRLRFTKVPGSGYVVYRPGGMGFDIDLL